MRKKKEYKQENLDYNDQTALISYQESPTRFSEHWHMSAEFILAMKDHCRYSVGKDEYHLSAGDVLLIWPTELHSVLSTPEKASLILQFDDTVIAGNHDLSLSLPVIQNIHLISAREEPELNRRVSALMLDSLRVFEDRDKAFKEVEYFGKFKDSALSANIGFGFSIDHMQAVIGYNIPLGKTGDFNSQYFEKVFHTTCKEKRWQVSLAYFF